MRSEVAKAAPRSFFRPEPGRNQRIVLGILNHNHFLQLNNQRWRIVVSLISSIIAELQISRTLVAVVIEIVCFPLALVLALAFVTVLTARTVSHSMVVSTSRIDDCCRVELMTRIGCCTKPFASERLVM
jgi:hypothetical protein